MTSEIEIIYQLTYKDVFESTFRSESDLKAWIANSNYFVDSPLEASSPNSRKANEFALRVNNVSYLISALSNDCNRFGQAALESIIRLDTHSKLPKSSAWSIIKMYYASFFAIHSILRIFGRTCSQLENEHVKSVFNMAQATNLDNGLASIENGFYYAKFDPQNKIFSFSKLKDSHADTWQCFGNLLSDLINEIPDKTVGLSTNKLKALDLLIKVKNYIYKSGASRGNWPSIIRNSINYQHSHGAWFPYTRLAFDYESVSRNMIWVNNPQSFDGETNKNEIEVFFNATNCIISLLYHLISYGYEKGDRKSIVLKNGIFRLINILTAI